MSATLDAGPVAAFLGCARRALRGQALRRRDRALPRSPTTARSSSRSRGACARSCTRASTATCSCSCRAPPRSAAPWRRCARLAADARPRARAAARRAAARGAGPRGRPVRPAQGDPLDQRRRESSVTIDGVVAVVDSGLARIARHSPWSGLPDARRREDEPRLRGAARGPRRAHAARALPAPLHAGRLRRAARARRRPRSRASISRRRVLELRGAGVARATSRGSTPPRPRRVAAAEALLARGSARSTPAGGAITDDRPAHARVPAPPAAARMLVEAERAAWATTARSSRRWSASATCARRRRRASSTAARRARSTSPPSRATRSACSIASARPRAAASRARAPRHRPRSGSRARRRARAKAARAARAHADASDAATPGPRTRRCSSPSSPATPIAWRAGKRPRLGASSCSRGRHRRARRDERGARPPWMVAVDAEDCARGRHAGARGERHRARVAARALRGRIREDVDVVVRRRRGRRSSAAQMLYDGLVLEESPGSTRHDPKVAELLFERARRGARARSSPDERSRRWLARARFAAHRRTRPSARPTDDDVMRALARAVRGQDHASRARERRSPRRAAQRARPAGAQARRARAGARQRSPSGRTAAVAYEDGKPPWVESRLQDFFGMPRPAARRARADGAAPARAEPARGAGDDRPRGLLGAPLPRASQGAAAQVPEARVARGHERRGPDEAAATAPLNVGAARTSSPSHSKSTTARNRPSRRP